MAEGKVFAITGFQGGVSVGVQADTPEEFAQLVANVRALTAQDPVLSQLFAPVVGVVQVPSMEQAVANVQAAIPGTTQVSTVGEAPPWQTNQAVAQPVHQPVAQPQRQQSQQRVVGPAGAPPNVAYPGDCAHGPRVYTDKPARGKAWVRWECNTPWSRGVQGRCDSINVES